MLPDIKKLFATKSILQRKGNPGKNNTDLKRICRFITYISNL